MTSPWLELLLLALLNTGGDAMSMGDGAHTPVVDVPLDESSGFPCGGFRGLHGHVCDEGEHQSPIDVHSGLAEPTSMHEAELSMHYPQYVTVSFDREAIPGGRWNVEPPHDAYVLLRGIKYHLVQFHAHSPSEHMLNGVRYPAEVHLVHMNRATCEMQIPGFTGACPNVVVVSVLFSGGAEPTTNSSWLDHLAAASNAGPLYEMDMTSNHLWRIVTTSGYYNYVGSLTTEPCAEGVEWFLSQYIEEAPIGQICFHQHQKVLGLLARKANPMNGRIVRSSVWASELQIINNTIVIEVLPKGYVPPVIMFFVGVLALMCVFCGPAVYLYRWLDRQRGKRLMRIDDARAAVSSVGESLSRFGSSLGSASMSSLGGGSFFGMGAGAQHAAHNHEAHVGLPPALPAASAQAPPLAAYVHDERAGAPAGHEQPTRPATGSGESNWLMGITVAGDPASSTGSAPTRAPKAG